MSWRSDGDAEPSLDEAVTKGAVWAFAVAQCELKGFRLARETSYGRLGSDGAMVLLAVMSRAGEPWPFSMLPAVLELTGWLERQDWGWSLCGNDLPERVLDDPDWRRHEWVLIFSDRGYHALAYRGETAADLFLGMFHDPLEGRKEGSNCPPSTTCLTTKSCWTFRRWTMEYAGDSRREQEV